jgi:hypothetical protein
MKTHVDRQTVCLSVCGPALHDTLMNGPISRTRFCRFPVSGTEQILPISLHQNPSYKTRRSLVVFTKNPFLSLLAGPQGWRLWRCSQGQTRSLTQTIVEFVVIHNHHFTVGKERTIKCWHRGTECFACRNLKPLAWASGPMTVSADVNWRTFLVLKFLIALAVFRLNNVLID